MKRFSTLLLGAVAVVGMAHADNVTVTWAFNGDATPVVSGTDPANIVLGDFKFGDKVAHTSYVSISTDGSVKGYHIACSVKTPSSSSADNTGAYWFEIPVAPAAGKKFTPKRVAFKGAKNGTGNEHYANVFWYDGTDKATIVNKFTFTRNDASGNFYAEFAGSVPENTGYETNTSLVFNLYSKPGAVYTSSSAGKGWIIGDLVIEGELTDAGFVDTRAEAPLAWSVPSVSLKVRDAFTAPTLSNAEGLPVTFATNNPAVATVDEAGAISLVEGGVGTAVISAFFDGNDTYKSAKVDCEIKVLTNVVEVSVLEAYSAVESVPVDYLWKASAEIAAGEQLVSDENITVTAPFLSKVQTYAANYAGYEFPKSIQVRVKSVPTADDLVGTDNGGSSSLVIAPKKDMTLYIFGRRQTLSLRTEVSDDVENNVITKTNIFGATPNDGKDIYLCDQANITTRMPHEILFGCDSGSPDYMFGVNKYELAADHTYTLWTYGTTYQMNGLGYKVAGNTTTGLGVVSAENAAAVYYNLQGQKIANPTAAGVYVVVRGGKASKVVVK